MGEWQDVTLRGVRWAELAGLLGAAANIPKSYREFAITEAELREAADALCETAVKELR